MPVRAEEDVARVDGYPPVEPALMGPPALPAPLAQLAQLVPIGPPAPPALNGANGANGVRRFDAVDVIGLYLFLCRELHRNSGMLFVPRLFPNYGAIAEHLRGRHVHLVVRDYAESFVDCMWVSNVSFLDSVEWAEDQGRLVEIIARVVRNHMEGHCHCHPAF